jgi:hypothetical protein
MDALEALDALGALDALDEELLDQLRECYAALDPMPPTLVERSLFAMALQDLDAGLVQIAEERDLAAVGARGEEARVITFESETITVMIRVSTQDGAQRIDGWLVPPGVRRVDLRTAGGTVSTFTDEQGRFVLEHVQPGLAQLAVQRRCDDAKPPGGEAGETVLTTPAIML